MKIFLTDVKLIRVLNTERICKEPQPITRRPTKARLPTFPHGNREWKKGHVRKDETNKREIFHNTGNTYVSTAQWTSKEPFLREVEKMMPWHGPKV